MPIGTRFDNQSLRYHFYADDTQVNISFDGLLCHSSVHLLSIASEDVQYWMVDNKLLFNPSKTEYLLLGTAQQLKKIGCLKPLKLSDSILELAEAALNLGVVFDSTVTLTD